MEKLEKLINNINALIDVALPENTIKGLTGLKEEVESLQKDIEAKDKAYIDLKQAYIDNLKAYPIGDKQTGTSPDNNAPLTFEQCLEQAIK